MLGFSFNKILNAMFASPLEKEFVSEERIVLSALSRTWEKHERKSAIVVAKMHPVHELSQDDDLKW